MSNDALILNLAAGLTPVRRRSMTREALLLLAVAVVEGALIVAAGLMRPDMAQMIGSSFMTWKIGSLAILAGLSCTVAMRSFSPHRSPRRGLRLAVGVAGLAVTVGAFLAFTADIQQPLIARVSPARGMLCAVSIIVLALPLLAVLRAMMRRAAPVFPQSSAFAAGLAAGTSGALVFTLCCPMNDPLYVLIWYCVGCTAVAALGRWLLPRHFRL
ncbi:NrsF family protein [Sphingomonas quercus]|uniref:DUF1109 domain-containing protein n=1 Tax=Sphingomonas quercus TaxID=2842451 RepID=A0ABS6BLM7_9SPHN|nr:DUF1109 domain-containing protein [Sphingomonas quercus]MBU3079214.1 DUF1109 domain-containing protein [Sphingomonas quercus]